MKLLIIEDEKGLSDAVAHTLRTRGWLVDQSYDGRDGRENAESGIYDLVVLDVMLPSLDGFSVLKALREEGISTPVLMLTAKGDLESRIRGLNLGADYYLPKPFDMNELIACINAITRRKDTHIREELSYEDIILKKDEGLLEKKGGEGIKLSAREINLLEMLLLSSGRAVSKDQIYEKLWGYDGSADTNATEVYISFLRKKLRYIGSRVEIRALRGIGYMLEAKNDQGPET